MDAFDVRFHREALLDPRCYPSPPDVVTLAETHISCVFIAGAFVYKLKKPVDFGFVDYTSVQRRRRFCELEVTLNGRLTDGIYLGVVPLVRTPEGLRFEAQGPAVDWAVKMSRVPDPALWSSRIAAGSLGQREMELLGRFVAKFHAQARRVRSKTAILGADTAWADNLRALAPFAGELFPGPLLLEIERKGTRLRGLLSPVLDARMRAGRFVDAHGDLRLEHIFESEGRLQALDCVEFSPALRRIDGASDLAFLQMDLDRNNRPDLATSLSAAYLRASGDASLPLCDGFYRAHRALVRAKVDALAQAAPGRSASDRQRLRSRAESWVDLANSYLKLGSCAAVIVVRGVSGSGKTTLATRLAATCGTAWLATDYLRKQSAGTAISTRLAPDAYTAQARRAVYGRLHRAAGHYLKLGLPVILDGTYLDAGVQKAAGSLARRYNVPALALTLELAPETLKQRLEARAPSASDAGWEVASEQLSRHGTKPFHGVSEVVLDGALPVEALLEQSLAYVRPLLEATA